MPSLHRLSHRLGYTILFASGLVLILIPLMLTGVIPDTLTAGRYYRRALEIREDQPDSALILLSRAGELYKSHNRYESFFRCSNAVAAIHRTNRESDKALKILEENLHQEIQFAGDQHEIIGETNHQLAMIYGEKGENYQALYYFEQAADHWEKAYGTRHVKVAKEFNNIGVFHKRNGRNDKALEFYFKALEILKKISKPGDPLIASVMNNIGTVYELRGDFDRALEYNRQAIAITLAGNPVNPDLLARKYNNLGNIYLAMEDTVFATENYLKALNLWNTEPEKRADDIASIYNNLAKTLRLQSEYGRSEKYYRKAITIWTDMHGSEHPDIAMCYYNLSNVFFDQERYDEAGKLTDQALKIWLSFYRPEHPYIALCYANFGKIAAALSRYHDAEEWFIRAERANRNKDRILGEKEEMEILTAKALMYIDKYNNKPENRADLQQAISSYRSILNLIDNLRKSFKAKQSMLALSKSSAGLYSQAVQVCYRMYELTRDQQYIEDAFYFAEKNRANVLVESILESRSAKYSGILDSLIERKEDLNARLVLADQGLQDERFKKEKRDESLIQRLETVFDSLQLACNQLQEMFEKNYKNYFNLKYNTATISTADLRKKLLDGEALIEYLTADTLLYIIVVTPEGCNFIESGAANLKNMTQTLLASISRLNLSGMNNTTIASYTAPARALYRQLIEPAESIIQGKKLIIVPDGPLGYIPFEVLLCSDPGEAGHNFRDMPYLLKKYPVCYANSSTIQFQLLNTIECKASKNFLGIAPYSNHMQNKNVIKSDGYRNLALGMLPNSLKEVESIVKMTGGLLISGKEATKARFMKECKGYKVIHLATHGVINDKYPLESGMLFYPSASDTADILTTQELFNRNFSAEMVVLSACNTGTGIMNEGEGIMSLARGFAYSGVPGIMMSLWNVNDKSTSAMMEIFYRYLNEGLSRSEALRKAKLDYISSSDNLHASPFYWGGFITIGRNDNIRFSHFKLLWIILPVLAAGLVAGVVVVKRRKKLYPKGTV